MELFIWLSSHWVFHISCCVTFKTPQCVTFKTPQVNGFSLRTFCRCSYHFTCIAHVVWPEDPLCPGPRHWLVWQNYKCRAYPDDRTTAAAAGLRTVACFAARPVRRRASSTISPYEALCIMVDDGACQVLDKSGSTTSADPFLGLQCYWVLIFSLAW